MLRSRILHLTVYRNTLPKTELIKSINPIFVSNLKRQNCNLVTNDICNENYGTVTNEIAKNMFPIAINDSSLNSFDGNNKINEKQAAANLTNKPKNHHASHNLNYTFIKYNPLQRTSNHLLSKHSYVKELCIGPIGVRHVSSETTPDVPIIRLTGFWKDMSECAPVQFVQDSLINFQSSTGLPWWATIILTTIIVRSTMTLPLSLYQHYIFAKVENLRVEMNDTIKELKIEANYSVLYRNWSEQYTRMIYNRSVQNKWNELIQRENCHPAKGLIVLWSQIPLWITISTALRNLCYMLPPDRPNAEQIFLELTTGGFGWVSNLIEVDHYWILSAFIGLFNLANIEIISLMKVKQNTRLQKYVLHFLRFVSIAMVPISTYVPSCICLYWASSSAFGLVQNLVLFSPKVRRFSGVPLTLTERKHPYRDLVKTFRSKKYFNFNRKDMSLK